MGVAGALIGSAVIGGATSIMGANAQKDAAETAADSAQQTNRETIEFNKWLYGDQKEQAKPWYNAGVDAITQLQSAIKDGTYNYDLSKVNQQQYNPVAFSGNVDVTQDPSYQFRLSQGVNALDHSAAASGMLQSGAQQKAITKYGQDLASQEYANAFARALQTNQTNNSDQANATQINNAANMNTVNTFLTELNNRFNRTASVSGAGQNANQSIANAGANMGNNVTSSLANTGAAVSAAATNAGNATANMYGGVATSANQGVQNYLSYSILKKNGLLN
jgi:hypothetical protein